jgi:hypothetical protein
MAPASSDGPRRLVYGHAKDHDCLAFADGETAVEEAEEIRAIAASRTWGEARRVAPSHTWNPAADEYAEEEHADDEPFDIGELSPVQDGDWPPMVTSRAMDLLPQDLQERFGEVQDTRLNADYLEIPLDREAELTAELRARGFDVTRDDDTINMLDGYGLRA